MPLTPALTSLAAVMLVVKRVVKLWKASILNSCKRENAFFSLLLWLHLFHTACVLYQVSIHTFEPQCWSLVRECLLDTCAVTSKSTSAWCLKLLVCVVLSYLYTTGVWDLELLVYACFLHTRVVTSPNAILIVTIYLKTADVLGEKITPKLQFTSRFSDRTVSPQISFANCHDPSVVASVILGSNFFVVRSRKRIDLGFKFGDVISFFSKVRVRQKFRWEGRVDHTHVPDSTLISDPSTPHGLGGLVTFLLLPFSLSL